mgnify:CR=1 FL=1
MSLFYLTSFLRVFFGDYNFILVFRMEAFFPMIPPVLLTELARLDDAPPFFEAGTSFPDFPRFSDAVDLDMRPEELVSMTKLFFEIFSEPVSLENFSTYSHMEKSSVAIAILSERISVFMRKLLLDLDSAVTVNSLCFLVEIWIYIRGEPPQAPAFRAFVSHFLERKSKITRRQFVKILCDVKLQVFFTTQVASSLPLLMNTNVVGDLKLPWTWARSEAPGLFFLLKKKKRFLIKRGSK